MNVRWLSGAPAPGWSTAAARRLCGPLMAAALLAIVAGCAGAPTRPAAPTAVNLADLAHWRARGRLGVIGVQRGGSGSFDWQQHGHRADIRIRGPLGLGSVRLQLFGDVGQPALKLETGDGLVLRSQAAWDELHARLGVELPAAALRYWMLGLAAPGEHQWHEDERTGDVVLQQDGWRIAYQHYSAEAGVHVPVKMRASNGQAQVRIVVDQWWLGR